MVRDTTSPRAIANALREAIHIEGVPVNLVDTAGLRRQARIEDKLETLSAEDSFRAVQYAQLVVLTLDATLDIARQDLTIARKVVEEGRILVIALNKWDLVEEKTGKTFDEYVARIRRDLPFLDFAPIVSISAKTGQRVQRVLPREEPLEIVT